MKNFPNLKILIKNRYFFFYFLGMFAFYNGLIYNNNFFARPLGNFGSYYKNQKKIGKY